MKYDAFISYSHAADGKLAPALQKALQRIARPFFRLRALNIFRDASSLAVTPHLWGAIEEALHESDYLILLSSPEAAASKWVNKEVEFWLTHKSKDNILIVLADGNIEWDDDLNDFNWEKTDALPTVLKGQFVAEPFYEDFRASKSNEDLSLSNPIFKNKAAKVASSIHGIPQQDLLGEDVRLMKRNKLLLNSGISLLTILLIGVIGFGIRSFQNANLANKNLNEAKRQERIALQRGDSLAEQLFISDSLAAAELLARILADSNARIALDRQEFAELQQFLANQQRDIAVKEREISEANSLSLLANLESDRKYLHRALTTAYKAQKKSNAPQSNGNISLSNILYDNISSPVPLLKAKLSHKSEKFMHHHFSPDSKMILATTFDGIKLWTVEGQLLFEKKAHDKKITKACFSADGKYVYTAAKDGKLKKWDHKGSILFEFDAQKEILGFTYDPVIDNILTYQKDSTAYIIDLKNEQHLELKKHQDLILDAFYTEKANTWFTITQYSIQGWKAGEKITHIESSKEIHNAKLFFNNKFIVTTHSYPTFLRLPTDIFGGLIDLMNSDYLEYNKYYIRDFGDHIPDSDKFIVSGRWNQEIWDLEGNSLFEIPAILNAPIKRENTETRIDSNHVLKVFNVLTNEGCQVVHNEKAKTIKSGADFLKNVVIHPSGSFILSYATNGVIKLWDFNCNMIQDLDIGTSTEIEKAFFSADGEYILARLDNELRIWSTEGVLKNIIAIEENKKLDDIGLSPNGKILAIASDNELFLWDFAHSNPLNDVNEILVRDHSKLNNDWITIFGDKVFLPYKNGKAVLRDVMNAQNSVFYIRKDKIEYIEALEDQFILISFENGGFEMRDYDGELICSDETVGKKITDLEIAPKKDCILGYSQDDYTAFIIDLKGKIIAELSFGKEIAYAIYDKKLGRAALVEATAYNTSPNKKDFLEVSVFNTYNNKKTKSFSYDTRSFSELYGFDCWYHLSNDSTTLEIYNAGGECMFHNTFPFKINELRLSDIENNPLLAIESQPIANTFQFELWALNNHSRIQSRTLKLQDEERSDEKTKKYEFSSIRFSAQQDEVLIYHRYQDHIKLYFLTKQGVITKTFNSTINMHDIFFPNVDRIYIHNYHTKESWIYDYKGKEILSYTYGSGYPGSNFISDKNEYYSITDLDGKIYLLNKYGQVLFEQQFNVAHRIESYSQSEEFILFYVRKNRRFKSDDVLKQSVYIALTPLGITNWMEKNKERFIWD